MGWWKFSQKIQKRPGRIVYQGAKISLFLNKNSFADTLDSQESSISLFIDNDIIERVATRRKENEINEENKIIASNLKYNPINDQINIMNRRRKKMTVKVIDERIKENNHHQHVANITDQGANISLFLNKKHEITEKSISNIPNLTSLHDSISSILETKALPSESLLINSFVDTLHSKGSRRSIFTTNEIIDHVVKKRKENESKTDKDISLIEKSNEYKSVTCINGKMNRLLSYPSYPTTNHTCSARTDTSSINPLIYSNHLLDKKTCHVFLNRIDQKSALCVSFDLTSSLHVNDELEMSATQVKDKTKEDQDSKGKRINEIISGYSGKHLRVGTECINDYRSVSSSGLNKKKLAL